MPRPKSDPDREERITMEIVVDAYGSEERSMAWYYYLEEQLTVPFEAEVRRRSPTSPLSPGDRVQVIAMAPEDGCQFEAFVWIRWNKRKLAVPLAQLVPLASDEMTQQAIADWQYWQDRGYQF
ncbi:calcium-binding protein [Cupriavidus sp. LEh25]|nr:MULTISPECIES: calcium-binding protein [unclassified Cupriavidus]MBP0625444.1 calcium-binding protein [Cupriavidus sp. LEh25]MDK2662187.1 calcium-binding protein [Cupriavidus sp. LEh21]